jgi:hypothetical protein
MIQRKWREGKVRPIQGNSPHDRLVSRGIFLIVTGAFATIPPRHSVAAMNSRAPGNAFLRHGGIYLSDARFSSNPSLDESRCLPPAAPNPSQRTCREEHALLIVQMSSGRLFLDRVARQHCPSPLHRHTQINMHSPQASGKGDISTLLRGGHFYFALT